MKTAEERTKKLEQRYSVATKLDRNYTNCEIAILSNSRAAIITLDVYIIKCNLVWKCLVKPEKLSGRKRVKLCRIEGKEMNDFLVRKEASEPFTGPYPFCTVVSQAFKEAFRELKRRNPTDN